MTLDMVLDVGKGGYIHQFNVLHNNQPPDLDNHHPSTINTVQLRVTTMQYIGGTNHLTFFPEHSWTVQNLHTRSDKAKNAAILSSVLCTTIDDEPSSHCEVFSISSMNGMQREATRYGTLPLRYRM
jgi:hypothetical protein